MPSGAEAWTPVNMCNHLVLKVRCGMQSGSTRPPVRKSLLFRSARQWRTALCESSVRTRTSSVKNYIWSWHKIAQLLLLDKGQTWLGELFIFGRAADSLYDWAVLALQLCQWEAWVKWLTCSSLCRHWHIRFSALICESGGGHRKCSVCVCLCVGWQCAAAPAVHFID